MYAKTKAILSSYFENGIRVRVSTFDTAYSLYYYYSKGAPYHSFSSRKRHHSLACLLLIKVSYERTHALNIKYNV